VHVFDAPGVRDGAFVLLEGHTEFLFLQHVAPPEVNLRGSIRSEAQWVTTLHELAAAAAAHAPPANAYVARHADGALEPFELDPQWPHSPAPGVSIVYARIGRRAPFAQDEVPVELLL